MRILRLLLLAGALCLGRAEAVQVIEVLSVPELARRSEAVVRGTVVEVACQRDEGGRIHTRAWVEVAEVWKGHLGSGRVEVVHGGGVLGTRQSRTFGQVEFGVGREVILFLRRNVRGEFLCLGMDQGKFDLARDRVSGVVQSWSPYHGFPPSASGAVGKLGPGGRPGALTVDVLRGLVREGSR